MDVSNVKSLADCAPIFETIHENEPDMKIIVGAKDGLIGNIYFADVLSDRFGVLDNGGADTTIVNYYETDNYKNLAATVHDYYEKGYIDRVITTNLTYLPAEAKEKPYFLIADMSKFIALIIDSMNHDISIGKVMDPTEKIHRLLAKHNTSL